MNNKEQFTPGPWVVNTFIVNGQHKLEVLDATGANACVQANAHLIAAAPAMYEALQHAAMSYHHPACKCKGEYSANPELYCTCHVQKARAALAQADGK